MLEKQEIVLPQSPQGKRHPTVPVALGVGGGSWTRHALCFCLSLKFVTSQPPTALDWGDSCAFCCCWPGMNSVFLPFCAGFGHRGRYRFNVNYQLSSNGSCTERARGRMSYHIVVTDSLFFTSPF